MIIYDETALIHEYIWADGKIVTVVENGTLCYVHRDHIGRPVFATKDAGGTSGLLRKILFGIAKANRRGNNAVLHLINQDHGVRSCRLSFFWTG